VKRTILVALLALAATATAAYTAPTHAKPSPAVAAATTKVTAAKASLTRAKASLAAAKKQDRAHKAEQRKAKRAAAKAAVKRIMESSDVAPEASEDTCRAIATKGETWEDACERVYGIAADAWDVNTGALK